MFHQKSKTDQAKRRADQAVSAAGSFAQNLRDRVVPATAAAKSWGKPRAEAAYDWTKPHAEAARDWAKPHVEHGIGMAAPKLESAVGQLSPKVDTARDKIVDEVLPRISEALATLAATKDDAVSRGSEAAYNISGGAVGKPKRKKGGFLIVLGLLTAAGAAAVAFAKKSSAPKDDPWATPLSEPYAAPASSSPSEAGIRAVDPELTGDSTRSTDTTDTAADEDTPLASTLGADDTTTDASPDTAGTPEELGGTPRP